MANPFVISAKFTLDGSSGIASANQIRQEFGKIEASAGSAATSIARMAEQQQRVGTLRASGINSALGVQDNFNSADRSADIAAYGRELDQLRARFNPVFAAQQQFVVLSGEINRAQQLGAISATEAAAAIRREETALMATTAALRQNSQAANENKAALAHHSAGRNNFNTANVAAQFQDIAVTSAMGMSPIQIALQQGTQISAVLGGGQGLTGVVRTLGSAFASVLSPVSLLTIAAVGLGAVGIQAMMGWISASGKAANGIDSVTQALAEQAAPVESIKGKISELQGITDAYAKAIRGTAKDQSIASQSIIANSEKEFNAKKSLLELELKRQKAAITVQEAELAIAGRTLRKEVSSALPTVDTSVASGYSDPKIGQFVRSPVQSNLLQRTQELIEANPLNDKIKETAANLDLAKISTEGLEDALKTTFSDSVATSIGRIASTTTSAAEKAAEKYRDLIRTAQQRIGLAEVEASTLGMTRESVARLTIAQELQNKAVNDNIKLTPRQITELDHYAASIATAEERTRSLSEIYGFGKDVFGSFFSDLKSGAKDGADALTVLGNAGANAFDRIADHALALAANSAFDLIFNAIMGGISGGFGGGIGSGLRGVSSITGSAGGFFPGFADGGPTGGVAGQVAGFVHGDEFVVRSGPATQHRKLLETINNGGTPDMGGGAQYSLPATYNFYGSGFTEEQALRIMAENERRRMEDLPAALADVQRRARAA